MTILDHEAPNMASALEHALETDPPAAMHIAVAHATYWALRGRITEAEAAYSAVLAAVTEPSALRARAWGRARNLLHGAGGSLQSRSPRRRSPSPSSSAISPRRREHSM